MSWRARFFAPVLTLSVCALFIAAAQVVLPLARAGTDGPAEIVALAVGRAEFWLLVGLFGICLAALATTSLTYTALLHRMRRMTVETRRIALGADDAAEGLPRPTEEIARIAHRLRGFALAVRKVATEKSEMERIAETDPLTGLPNRRGLLNFVSKVIGHNRGWIDPMRVGLMHIDLDHFKTVNDTLGHEAGDQVLREAARRMEATVRETDLIARLGGDEFVIVLPGIDNEAVLARLAERLIEQFEVPVDLGEESCRVGLSIGVVLGPSRQTLTDPKTLLTHADLALSHAKLTGRGRYAFYNPSIAKAHRKELGQAEEIRQGILDEAFQPGFCPIVTLGTGLPIAFSVVPRWHRDGAPPEGPEVFLKSSEIDNMIDELGMQVLEKTCEAAAAWRRAGLSVPKIAFSMTRGQLIAPGVIDKFSWTLDETNTPLSLFAVEVEEGICRSRSFELVLANLKRLRALEIETVLSGFGASGASLRSINQLSPYLMKMGWFDPDAHAPGDDAANHARFLGQVPAIARAMNVDVVATGLDDLQSALAAERSGYIHGQGTQVAPVMTAMEAEAWLHAIQSGDAQPEVQPRPA